MTTEQPPNTKTEPPVAAGGQLRTAAEWPNYDPTTPRAFCAMLSVSPGALLDRTDRLKLRLHTCRTACVSGAMPLAAQI